MGKVTYKEQIIKIQKPILSNGPAEALIYNEDRSLMTMLPWTQELDKMFGGDLKQYWLARVPQADGHYIKLVKQVDWQDW